nr:neurexin 2a [Hymenolepis microstoma]
MPYNILKEIEFAISLVIANCFFYSFVLNGVILLMSWRNAFLEPSEVDNHALLIILSNGSIEFQLRSPNSPKLVTVQKRQNCESPYGACSDNTWHHLSFSYNRIRIFYHNDKDFTNLFNLVEIINSSKQSEVGREIGDIKYESVSFQTFSIKTKRDMHPGGNSGTVVTFKRPGGYLRSQRGWRTVSAGKISFQMRTLKSNSLLLFSLSGWPRGEKKYAMPRDGPIYPVNPVDRLTGNDIFGAEIREGYLVFLHNTGSGISEFSTGSIWRGGQHKSRWFVADGVKHSVEIQLSNGSLSVTLDGNMLNMRPKTKPKYTVLNLNGNLYIGGMPEELRDETPPQAWSARLREDFVGELGSLSIDGVMLDLALESKARWAKGYIEPHDRDASSFGDICSKTESPCGSGQCIKDSWSEPLCDCVHTNYTGARCNETNHWRLTQCPIPTMTLGQSGVNWPEPEPASLFIDGQGWFNFFPKFDHLNHGSGMSILFKTKEPNSLILYAEVTMLVFDGFQGIGIRLSHLPKQSEAESLVLRLQTYQKNALIFESSSTSSTASDRFGVEIVDRKLVVFYNLGFETKRYATAEIEANGEWHTLQILRRSKELKINVDNVTYNFDIKDDATILDSDYDCIGTLVDETSTQRMDLQYDAFIGRLSQFRLNGLDMLKIISEVANYRSKENTFSNYDSGLVTLLDTWKENIEVTAISSNEDKIRAFPLQFQGGSSLMEFSLTIAACVYVKFSMKTSSNKCVILAFANSKEDYVGLEILAAHLHVSFRCAQIRGQSAFEKTAALNDTQWHDIRIQLCTEGIFKLVLELDGEKYIPTGLTEGRETFSTRTFERLYLGGIPSEAGDLRKQFHSSSGYDGCLANIDLIYGSSMTSVAIFPYPPTNPLRIAKETRGVQLGCRLMPYRTAEGVWGVNRASNQCRPGVCGFGGRCVQQLDMYFCDCIMSGFNGPVCTDVATTIKYADKATEAGCAIFEFNPLRNTSRDAISFGIQTTQKSPASLLHIMSHSKSLDFLAIELVEYRKIIALRLTYNMGSGIQTLQEPNVDISDGMFHMVRVIRNNAHMQLQVDSEEVREYKSEGTSGNHFNEVYQVYVGCEPARAIYDPSTTFVGYISGVNINGIFLADLLLGETISGIFYKDGKNLLIDPTFTPKVRQTSNLPANDMGAEQPHQSPSKPLTPLVVAKPNCYDNEADLRNKLASCKSLNPNGIIIPKWNLPPPKDASSSLPYQGNSWGLHQSMTQHHQAPATDDSDHVSNNEKIYSPDSNKIFPPWSDDRAPQDDEIGFNSGDSILNLEQPPEIIGNSPPGIINYFSSLYTWLLLAGCGAAILIIFLTVGYAVYKFRRRNEGSYNVEENRTFIDQRSTSTLSPTSLLATPVEPPTELTTLQRCTLVEPVTPNKEWYV